MGQNNTVLRGSFDETRSNPDPREEKIKIVFDLLSKRNSSASFKSEVALAALDFVIKESQLLRLNFLPHDQVCWLKEKEEKHKLKKREYSKNSAERRILEEKYQSGELQRPRPLMDLLNEVASFAVIGQEVYNKIKLQGKSIGDIWYNELEEYRQCGAFEANICQQILNHTRPIGNAQVKDLVTPRVLAEMASAAMNNTKN